MSLTLTSRASELLRFIEAYTAAHAGVGPSRREMADAIGEKSVSGAQRLFDQLVDRGLVKRLPGKVRAIEIVRGRSITLPADLYAQLVRIADRDDCTPDETAVSCLRAWFAGD